MSVSKEDVKNAYRYILGRDENSEDAIHFWMDHADSWQELRKYFLASEEYQLKHADSTISDSHEDFYLKKCDKNLLWCLRSDGNDNVSQAIKAKGSWNEAAGLQETVSALNKNNKIGGVVLDLGANVGAISVPFAQAGWHAIAVEAGSRNVDALRITSKLNNLDIEVLPYIVHAETGTMYFHQNGPWGFVTNDIVKEKDAQPLNAFKLDDLERIAGHDVNRIDFVKMDVEGSEPAAVRGGREFFKRYGYPPVFCEANRWTLIMQGESVRSLKEAFAEQGYRPYVIRNGRLWQVLDPENEIETVTNYYFIHDSRVPKEYVSDKDWKIADHDYAKRVEDYVDAYGKRLDVTYKLSVLMLLRQNAELMSNPKLKAFADAAEQELRNADLLSKLIDQCYQQMA